MLRICALFVLVCGVASAATVTSNPRLYQPVVIDVTGPSASETDSIPNPFLDYRYEVTITAPSGAIFRVPGYFDGNGSGGGSGTVWRCKFLPEEVGTYSYVVSFRSGSEVAIQTSTTAGTAISPNGESGTFNVGTLPSTAEGFFKHGIMRPNGWYGQFTDGIWFVKVGMDSPENFLSFKDFDNTPNGRYDYASHVGDWNSGDPTWGSGKGKGIIGALNYFSEVGLNSIYFLPMNIGGDGKDVAPYVSVSNWSGSTGNDNEHFDISKLRQWGIVFEHAASKGLQLHFVLAEAEEANKRELDNATLGTERKLYYREMIARYGYLPAVQWNISEEYDLDLDLGPTKVTEWAEWIAQVDPFEHGIAVHNTGSIDNEYRSFFDSNSPFTTTSLQYWDYNDLLGQVENARSDAASRGGPIPLNFDETSKLGTSSSSANAARKNFIWPSLISGAGGVELYTDKDISTNNHRDYDFGYTYGGIARRFFDDHLPYNEMSPQDSLLSGETSGEGDVLAKVGAVYAIYLPASYNTGSLSLPGGSYTLRWFNPRNGQFEGSSVSLTGGSSVALGSVPSSSAEDWVALVTNDAGGGNEAPSVSFAVPANASVFDIGATVSVTVNASDSDGSIASVALYLNGSLVRTEGSAPYEWGSNAGDGALQNMAEGSYVLEAIATDNEGATGSAQITFNVTDPNANHAPAVDAGPATMSGAINSPLTLQGSVSDDGRPSGNISISWAANPSAGVSFVDPNDPLSEVTFTNAGSYVLTLSADDSELSASDSVTITITDPSSGPQVALHLVDAVTDQAIAGFAPISENATFDLDTLGGNGISIDAIPSEAVDSISFSWSGDASGSKTESVAPYAINGDSSGDFHAWEVGAGTYTITASAHSGGSVVATVTRTITLVNNGGNGGVNQAPEVNAGPDQSIDDGQAATLDGTVTDADGDSLTVTWSITSGPGTVSFANVNAVDTSASFSGTGTYVLTLSADDGTITSSDSTTITVTAAGGGGSGEVVLAINCGGGSLTTADGIAYVADQGATGGSTRTKTGDVLGTTDDDLYLSYRFGTGLAYSLPVADGDYELVLSFADTWATEVGQRAIDVTAEGQLVADDLDLVAVAGHMTAYDLTVSVTIADGNFDLTVDNGIVSAFRLRRVGSPVSRSISMVIIDGYWWAIDPAGGNESDDGNEQTFNGLDASRDYILTPQPAGAG